MEGRYQNLKDPPPKFLPLARAGRASAYYLTEEASSVALDSGRTLVAGQAEPGGMAVTPDSRPAPSPNDERWRSMLLNPNPHRGKRRFFGRLPTSPRCKFCAAPFAGPGRLIASAMGMTRWPHNPKYCRRCFAMLQSNRGGAEIECSLLFADVRGSTTLAEQMSPKAFNRLMGRFYDVSLSVLVEHDAYVDKFVGDEVIAVFVPAMTGEAHAARAVDAARSLLRATFDAGGSAWIPVGIGVNTGIAYVGSVGDGPDTELTAMGDAVNVTARLSSAAAAGEILIARSAAQAAGLATDGLPLRSIALKGKSEPTEVVSLIA